MSEVIGTPSTFSAAPSGCYFALHPCDGPKENEFRTVFRKVPYGDRCNATGRMNKDFGTVIADNAKIWILTAAQVAEVDAKIANYKPQTPTVEPANGIWPLTLQKPPYGVRVLGFIGDQWDIITFSNDYGVDWWKTEDCLEQLKAPTHWKHLPPAPEPA